MKTKQFNILFSINVVLITLITNLSSQTLCFLSGNRICISDLEMQNVDTLIEGNFRNPKINQTGDYIAVNENYKIEDKWVSKVILVDTHEKTKIHLENLPGPRTRLISWIGKEDTLLISYYNGNFWEYYFYSIAAKKSIFLLESKSYDFAYYDNIKQQIILYDQEYFYKFSSNGVLRRLFPLYEILDEYGYSSSIDFCLSPNGNYLLFNIMDEQEYQKGMIEPPDILVMYDFEMNVIKSILPSKLGLSCSNPIWSNYPDEILFLGYDYKTQRRDLYKFSEKKLIKLFENCESLNSTQY